MKIAIISDTHDNWVNIKKALDIINSQGAEALIHCGDVCAPVTLKKISEQFTNPIHLIFGNIDGEEYLMTKRVYEGEIPNVELYKNIGEFEIDGPPRLASGEAGKKVAITHYPETAKALAQSGNHDAIFYGHSHKASVEKIGNTHLVNPGNVAGIIHPASFAIWDTNTNQVRVDSLND